MSPSPLPLERWLAERDGEVGLVFGDVVDSTELLFSKETVDYTSMLRAYRARARDLVAKHGGRVVDESGDEVFAAFDGAAQAFAFARSFFDDPGHQKLTVRVGVHVGSVRAEGDALVGRNVHFAARVMQTAAERELWASDAAKRALEREAPDEAAGIAWVTSEERTLRGVPERQRLWRAG